MKWGGLWMLAMVFSMIFLTGYADAAWWDPDWQYRKEITINNSGEMLSDYQVLVLLNAGNFDYSRAGSGGAGAAPYAYIANGYSDNVSVIDTATNTVTASVIVGSHPYGVAVNPDGTRVYVSNTGSNSVSVIDTATNTVIATVPVGQNPTGVAVNPDGTRLYVNSWYPFKVQAIDTATNTITATVPVGTAPTGVAVNPTGTRVYVTNTQSSNVSVIDTATNKVVASVSIGNLAYGVAVNPDGTRVYVANAQSDNVSVINTATNTVVASVPGNFPYGVAVNPDGTRVYVTNIRSNTVSVIDTAANKVMASITVGQSPEGVAVNDKGTRVYAVNYGSFSVSVIDTATNAVIATVPVGRYPDSVGLFIGPSPKTPIDLSPPVSITNLQNSTFAQNYINWTWTDPADPDFANVSVWIDNAFKSNISKGTQFYNATGFAPDSEHTISTRTMDAIGNINRTWINHTARTRPFEAANFDNWQYYRDITINNTGATALSDYQVLINLTGAAFPWHANTSGADIRFEQDGAELSYWIEKWDHANASALVWVNVTGVPVGESIVRMWYGNERAADVSEVNSTFIRVVDGNVMSLSMDEGSGATAYDKSGNGNNGALNGATWIDGKFGKGLKFDGINDYVEIPDKPELKPSTVTIASWIKINDFTSYGGHGVQYIIFKKNSRISEFEGYTLAFINSTRSFMGMVSSTSGIQAGVGTIPISLNQWYYITLIADSNKIAIYLNGDFQEQKNTVFPLNYDSRPLFIGKSGESYEGMFNGTIDDVRIYNRTLSPSEISDIYL